MDVRVHWLWLEPQFLQCGHKLQRHGLEISPQVEILLVSRFVLRNGRKPQYHRLSQVNTASGPSLRTHFGCNVLTMCRFGHIWPRGLIKEKYRLETTSCVWSWKFCLFNNSCWSCGFHRCLPFGSFRMLPGHYGAINALTFHRAKYQEWNLAEHGTATE